MQKGRHNLVSEYQCLGDLQIPEDQPLLGSPYTRSDTHSHGLAIIICTASVLFIASATNGLVTLNIIRELNYGERHLKYPSQFCIWLHRIRQAHNSTGQ
ncbi:hypothetical protein N7527_004385 [Penicillium freii]|nr:hypothetical protein N7527_004385 [Penicillium freii]